MMKKIHKTYYTQQSKKALAQTAKAFFDAKGDERI
jgi:hypothetical protein